MSMASRHHALRLAAWATPMALAIFACLPWPLAQVPTPVSDGPTLAAPAPTAPAPLPPPATGRAARVVREAPAPSCPYQQLDIVSATGQAWRACVSPPLVAPSGDLRSHHLSPQGLSTWTLRVDTGGSQVRAIVLTDGAGGSYHCGRDACHGAVVGPRNAQGGQTLSLKAVALVARPPPGAQEPPPTAQVTLDASIQVPSDQDNPDLACGQTRITLVERSGAVWTLCPSGGGGMVLAPRGHRVYRLRGEAGDTLEVGVDAQGEVDLVRLAELQCRRHGCAGATTRPGNEVGQEAGRVFSFSGTTLTDGRPGGRTATLNGEAVLPAF